MRCLSTRLARFFAAALAVCLVLSSCAPPEETRFDARGGLSAERSKKNFSEFAYERPDFGRINASADRAFAAVSGSGRREELFSLYQELLQTYVRVSTSYGLAQVHSDLDVTDDFYAEEESVCFEGLNDFSTRLNDLTGAILDSEHGSAARAEWGEDYVALFEKNRGLTDAEADPLLARDQKLQAQYQKESTSFRADIGGKRMTLEEIVGAGMESAEYMPAVNEFYSQRNKQLGDIFLQMLPLRRAVAGVLDMESYAAYSYASYGRDFSPEESAAFCKAVKAELAPVYVELLKQYGEDGYTAGFSYSLTPEDALPVLKESLSAEFPDEMGEALSFMLRHGLYDFSRSDKKEQSSFTMFLGGYNVPFLYITPSGGYQDVSTLFHEFGHYNSFYQAGGGGWNTASSLDLAEVQSQGLELLLLDSYGRIYEPEDVEPIRRRVLLDLLFSLVSGCMEDEFQREIYAKPDITLEEINQVHTRLRGEYFLDYFETSGYIPLDWVEIGHTFEAPFYYISYAVSVAAAFELWGLSLDDRPAALEAYAKLARMGNGVSFREGLSACGLGDPMNPERLQSLAGGIAEFFEGDAASKQGEKAA